MPNQLSIYSRWMEQMGCPFSGPKPKERSMDSLSSNSAESPPRKGMAAKQPPAPGVKEKRTAGRNSAGIPQIVVTSASDETLGGSPEQRTIREDVVFGPYARHRNPSTIDAYALTSKE